MVTKVGSPSYLSLTVDEEFIQLMSDKVRETIKAEISEAKYFSVSVNSTQMQPMSTR